MRLWILLREAWLHPMAVKLFLSACCTGRRGAAGARAGVGGGVVVGPSSIIPQTFFRFDLDVSEGVQILTKKGATKRASASFGAKNVCADTLFFHPSMRA